MKRLLSVISLLVLTGTLINYPVAAKNLQQAKQKPITLWTKFNDANPQNTQDQWLADALKEYTTTTGNKVTSVTQPYDQINSLLNVAVREGSDVPDVSYVDSQQVGFFTQNGTLTDLTDWVKGAKWYADLNSQALASCTAPDGKILCVPNSTAATLIYFWKDMYPNGFPPTVDKLMVAAKALKDKGKFAISMKASEKFSIELTFYGLIKSAGGDIAGPDGKAAWSSPKSAAAVKAIRDLFVNKYAPEIDLAPGFGDEEPFKRADAGALMAGSWSYVYLSPLTSPDGVKFDEGAGSLAAAYDAGKVDFAPPLAMPDGKPVSTAVATGWAIPRGAANVDGAQAFIDFQMTTTRDAKSAVPRGEIFLLVSPLY